MGREQRTRRQMQKAAVSICRLVRQQDGGIRVEGDDSIRRDMLVTHYTDWTRTHYPQWERILRARIETELIKRIRVLSLRDRLSKARLLSRLIRTDSEPSKAPSPAVSERVEHPPIGINTPPLPRKI